MMMKERHNKNNVEIQDNPEKAEIQEEKDSNDIPTSLLQKSMATITKNKKTVPKFLEEEDSS